MNPDTPIAGIYVAAVTPQRKGGEADVAAMLELVDFLAAAGVNGIALLGSTGEFLHLTFEDRVRLVQLAVKRSRVPVLVGVGHSTLEGAIELGRDAVSAGAAGLLLMPPYFFRYSQEDIHEFYVQFAVGVGSTARIFLYNIPFFTNEIAIETASYFLLAAGVPPGNDWLYDQFRRKPAQRVVAVTDAVTIAGDRFDFTADYHGLEVIPQAGTVIAHDGETAIRTPYDDCVLIMPSRRLLRGQTAVRLGRFTA